MEEPLKSVSAVKKRKRNRRADRPLVPETGIFELRRLTEWEWSNPSFRNMCISAADEYLRRIERDQRHRVTKAVAAVGPSDLDVARGRRGAKSNDQEIIKGLDFVVPLLSASEAVKEATGKEASEAARAVNDDFLRCIDACLIEGVSLEEIGRSILHWKFRHKVTRSDVCRRQAADWIGRGLEQMARLLDLVGGRE